MAYATAADVLKAYDARTIGKLVNDDGTEATTEQLLAPHANLTFALDRAEGVAHAYLVQGGRYTQDQLDGLDPDSRAAKLLQDIVCKLAMLRLLDRRPFMFKELREIVGKECTDALEFLRKGQNVLDLTPEDQTDDAATPEVIKETPATIIARNQIVDECTGVGRFYPGQMLQDPYNR